MYHVKLVCQGLRKFSGMPLELGKPGRRRPQPEEEERKEEWVWTKAEARVGRGGGWAIGCREENAGDAALARVQGRSREEEAG